MAVDAGVGVGVDDGVTMAGLGTSIAVTLAFVVDVDGTWATLYTSPVAMVAADEGFCFVLIADARSRCFAF